jgi:hypothetical protein
MSNKYYILRFLKAYYKMYELIVINSGGKIMGEHKDHMCEFAKHHGVDDMRVRVKDAKFICEVCGRAANSKDYLCRPTKL